MIRLLVSFKAAFISCEFCSNIKFPKIVVWLLVGVCVCVRAILFILYPYNENTGDLLKIVFF